MHCFIENIYITVMFEFTFCDIYIFANFTKTIFYTIYSLVCHSMVVDQIRPIWHIIKQKKIAGSKEFIIMGVHCITWLLSSPFFLNPLTYMYLHNIIVNTLGICPSGFSKKWSIPTLPFSNNFLASDIFVSYHHTTVDKRDLSDCLAWKPQLDFLYL